MTDQELREQFEQGTLPKEGFRHREHVRMAFLYLSEYPALRALEVFSEALQRFAALHGKPQLYHETITWAYVFLIRERMARAGRQQDWEQFARNNADLLCSGNAVLKQFYRLETIASELARTTFILPDRYSSDQAKSETEAP
jgi:hypothetical protein